MRRLLAAATAGLLFVGGLAGCGSDDSDSGLEVDVKRDEVTVKSGGNSLRIGDAKLPDDFPEDDVPVPNGGTLKAVVSGAPEGEQYFSLTYSIKGRDLKSVASDYREALKDDGYAIESSSSVGGSSGSFAAFTAVGPDWDVIAYSGGSADVGGALSLQVTTHDPKQDLPGS